MAVKHKSLGRGLGGNGVNALIPPVKNSDETKSVPDPYQEQSDVDNHSISWVKISELEPNREQPRKQFDEDALVELSESIRQYGVISPLLVKKQEGYYEIIAGERRWRAARIAGLKELPVILRDSSDLETVELSLIENIQREDLNPIEEAWAYRRLIDEFHMKQDDIAQKVSKSRAAITNSLRLLNLSEKVQQMLIDGMITSGHARAILSVTNLPLQEVIADQVFDEKLSVRETEKLVKSYLNPKTEKEKSNTLDDTLYEDLENRLQSIIGTKVSIKRNKNQKGKIEIEYYSRNDLDRLIALLESVK